MASNSSVPSARLRAAKIETDYEDRHIQSWARRTLYGCAATLAAIALGCSSHQSVVVTDEAAPPSLEIGEPGSAQDTLSRADRSPGHTSPESIIFVIADGTGVGAYTVGFYTNGASTQSSPFRNFEHTGLVSTHPRDPSEVTDSAAAATALATGSKTDNGIVGLTPDGLPLESSLLRAQAHQWHTGIVATSTLTHATPASFVAHVRSRKQESEIAAQIVQAKLDLAIGGGADLFAPFRADLESNGAVFLDADNWHSPAISATRGPVWGLLAEEALPDARTRTTSTWRMAEKALELLSARGRFFLLVEESQIDWAGHQNDAPYLAAEMRSFHELVEGLTAWQREHPQVLLVITSDHETGATSVRGGDAGHVSVHFATTEHSANLVPIWAIGPGSKQFSGLLDNTEVGLRMKSLIRDQPESHRLPPSR